MEKIVTTVRPGVKGILNQSAINELDENNCTMPNIDRVIYNVGKKAYPQRDPQTGKVLKDEKGEVILTPEVPVLATTLFFCDGTKVSVINSQNDGVEFEDYTLSNGEKIQVATKESKERGLIYGIMKRYVSKPDAKGKMVDSGLGRILNELVDGAYDTNVANREAKIAKAKSKAAAEEAKKNPKPKKVRYSINGTLERINKLLDQIECDPDGLAKVAKIFKD